MLQQFNWFGKKLLILGATTLHSEIAKTARSYGAYIGVVDPYKDSFAKRFADVSFEEDVMNTSSIVRIVKDNDFDGVITGFSDALLEPYLTICREANLPCSVSEKIIRISKDKQYFLELCQKYNIETPKRFTLDEIESESFVFRPLIVKPNDNSGARGISICRTPAELKCAIDEAKSNSFSGDIVIDEYMELEEATLFYLFDKGKAYISAMGDRHIYNVNRDNGLRLPTGYTFPSKALPFVIDELDTKFKKLFKELEVSDGMVFIQGMVSNNAFIPYECGFRLTGSLEYKLNRSANHFDPMCNIINFALTGDMAIREDLLNPNFEQKHFNISCLLKEGNISSISGLEELKKYDDFLGYFLSYYTGQGISKKNIGKLAQIGVRLFFREDQSSYDEMIEHIKANLRIIDSNNQDLLLNYEIRK